MFPLQKAAYDENAVLVLNRKSVPFTVRPQLALAPRPDGQYDAAELRAGCAQALGYVRSLDGSQAARQCAGVRFVYGKKPDANVRLRRGEGAEQALAVADEAGDAAVVYRFGAANERAQVVTVNAPLAILPLIE